MNGKVHRKQRPSLKNLFDDPNIPTSPVNNTDSHNRVLSPVKLRPSTVREKRHELYHEETFDEIQERIESSVDSMILQDLDSQNAASFRNMHTLIELELKYNTNVNLLDRMHKLF